MSSSPYQQLEQEWRRLHAFRGASALLRWDAAVMMPRGSAEVRGEQLAAIATEQHALLIAPRVTRLLERARANAQGLSDWQLANLREMQRQRDHAIATPVMLVSRLAKAAAKAEAAWAEARGENRFEIFAPHLQELLTLVQEKAKLLGQALALSPYDALMDEFSAGAGTADVDALFKTLSRRLPAMIRTVEAAQAAQALPPFSGKFTPGRQRALCVEVMKALGFPFERGRLDESLHPFTEGVVGDIRVTTRFAPDHPLTGLLGALHETGHALYDVNIPAEWRDQPVGRDRGMAMEESQSLLLELFVGRSRAFLTWLQPLLLKHYGVSGPEWEVPALYARLTRVQRSLIRSDADELSYALHIQQRYDIERRLLEGRLAVRDLPAAWDAGMEQRFGARPANLAEGCLQDVHWALGFFGYFPGYVLGAAIAAQLWEALRAQRSSVEEEIARGDFGGMLGWLRENVHATAALLPIKELVRQASGQPLGANALLRYLDHKYLES